MDFIITILPVVTKDLPISPFKHVRYMLYRRQIGHVQGPKIKIVVYFSTPYQSNTNILFYSLLPFRIVINIIVWFCPLVARYRVKT